MIDPSNITQSIVNTSKNMVHTSTTAQNMIKNFKETVKIYEQGKKYYDALKSVNKLVKDARKVQQTILMVGDITAVSYTHLDVYKRQARQCGGLPGGREFPHLHRTGGVPVHRGNPFCSSVPDTSIRDNRLFQASAD